MFERELKVIELHFAKWNDFVSDIKPEDNVGIVYHADSDGLIGATYCSIFIREKFGSNIFNYWITNSEFDFKGLFQFIESKKINKLITVDISIENYPKVVSSLVEKIEKLFIFDHHFWIHKESDSSGKVFIINPTPSKITEQTPVPTFLFAYFLSTIGNIPFPDWLLFTAIFAEGVDDYFESEIKKISLALGIKIEQDIKLSYRKSLFSKISSYIKTEFNINKKTNFVLSELTKCILEYPDNYQIFIKNLEKVLKRQSEEVKASISKYINLWESLLGLPEYESKKFILVPVEHFANIEGPIASILRGKFNKVIVAFKIYDNKVVYEFRAPDDDPINMVKLLDEINNANPNIFLNYGGHPTACGCSILLKDLIDFNIILEEKFLNNG